MLVTIDKLNKKRINKTSLKGSTVNREEMAKMKRTEIAKMVFALIPMQQVKEGFGVLARFVTGKLILRGELNARDERNFLRFLTKHKEHILDNSAIEVFHNDKQITKKRLFHSCVQKNGKLKPQNGCPFCGQVACQMRRYLPAFQRGER
jgi:hypothetical protein